MQTAEPKQGGYWVIALLCCCEKTGTWLIWNLESGMRVPELRGVAGCCGLRRLTVAR